MGFRSKARGVWVINKIVTDTGAEEVSVKEFSADQSAGRPLVFGCSQRIAHIEAETDDLDSEEIASTLGDGSIDEPERYDLYDIFTRHLPGLRSRGESDDE